MDENLEVEIDRIVHLCNTLIYNLSVLGGQHHLRLTLSNFHCSRVTKILRDWFCTGLNLLLKYHCNGGSPVRYVLKIHFFIEFGLKMIQFKTKSKIFIQKNIHSKQNPKYSFKKIFIQ